MSSLHLGSAALSLHKLCPAGVKVCGAQDPQPQKAHTPPHRAAQRGDLLAQSAMCAIVATCMRMPSPVNHCQIAEY